MSLTMCGLLGLVILILASRYGYNIGYMDGYKQCVEDKQCTEDINKKDRTNKTGTN